jgi:hypothetical protein
VERSRNLRDDVWLFYVTRARLNLFANSRVQDVSEVDSGAQVLADPLAVRVDAGPADLKHQTPSAANKRLCDHLVSNKGQKGQQSVGLVHKMIYRIFRGWVLP